ncbi:MAG: ATP-binding cassette domain-containing protein [Flavobacteriales bacterium]|jgi:phospholipid/cholesterol/gamma-HCH transport system ATP-binding protein|nr:ATP-binding cassette domain-containing protein [Flavobacteriales bacterium]MBT3962864.1 ATP-binding cassette domain-containing protein [Flavobacteriales bacterium]MBT4705882.1 ATP-binding cassette domain-containing protein [Flavobacteriales bacterium]MBT4931554.1 ATP-binding cassette domain-containing protein [Flavobacteriales bacterium]MBT5133781.1 ATP-binding cassette domain-containing protein [Flavobacteriales bacterium]
MIEVTGLYKSFGENKVLDDITSSFEEGKTSLIIGASGSGKSTLARCLVGLVAPDEGGVLFDGRDFLGMTGKERRGMLKEVGFLFQGSALFDFMTVEENIRFPLDMLTKMSTDEKAERVQFVLDRVELKDAHKLFPSELSGGMKKRVGIARAIAPNPKYLFCDEPNSGLDPQTSIVIDNLIHEITQESNITTVVITHDMNSVIEVGDYIMFLHQGKNWWEGDNKSILKTENQEVLDFVYASEFMKKIKA